jgi:uncharacterized membrane protein
MNENNDQGFVPVAPKHHTTHHAPHEKSPVPSAQPSMAPMPAPMGMATDVNGVPIKQTSVLAILSLILGIISVLFALLALPSLIVSIFAMKQTSQGKQAGRGMAIAGLVLSIISMLMMVFFVVMVGLGLILSNAESKNYSNSNSSSSYNYQSEKEIVSGILKTPVVADVYTLTVNSVDHGYKPTKDYYVPATGSEYVVVSVTIKNTDSISRSYSPYDFKLTDDSGKTYYNKYLLGLADDFNYDTVATSANKTGSMVYEVPKDAVGLKLVYAPYSSTKQAEITL